MRGPSRASVDSNGERPLVILKFGSSVLDSPAGFRLAALEVSREVQNGRKVVAVASAIRGTTDTLLATAQDVSLRPHDGAVARLLSKGEEISVILLGMALTEERINAVTLDAEALGLRTRGPLLDGEPRGIDRRALANQLGRVEALVVPGFVGTSDAGVPSLLGRGGSDLSALYLADELGAAECRLVKDVDGLYAEDPVTSIAGLAPFDWASWDEVLLYGGSLVQSRAVQFAKQNGIEFVVCSPGGVGTRIGRRPAADSSLETTRDSRSPERRYRQ